MSDTMDNEFERLFDEFPLSDGFADLGDHGEAVYDWLEEADDRFLPQRLWALDPTIWSDDKAVQTKILNRLGWLSAPLVMQARLEELSWLGELEPSDIVLLGMGGSSLAPELFQRVFGDPERSPRLHVLDNTTAGAVAALRDQLDLARTLFIVSSKSGGTLETRAFEEYFYELGGRDGAQFIAITDPGSELMRKAMERGYLLFLNPQDIGGRYSALSFFGLVPAALIDVNVEELLLAADLEVDQCTGLYPAVESSPMVLGAAMGILAQAGRNKLTLLTSPTLAAFGDWAEQLIAESTGKEGKGILPVVGERPAAPDAYGDDRLFVYLRLGNEDEALDGAVAALREAGHPLIQFDLDSPYDLGAHFLRWEVATAIAGEILGINPFDEPNVTESKENTAKFLAQWEADGRFPETDEIAGEGAAEALDAFVAEASVPDYVAILAYLPMNEANEAALRELQAAIRDRTSCATTLGFGPRFLHSTGQYHKGGVPEGRFIQIVGDDGEEIAIPGMPFDFATLASAQALGDLQALTSRDFPTLRLRLGGDPADAIARLAEGLRG